jgi:flagellin-like hook-associated protein FlgL
MMSLATEKFNGVPLFDASTEVGKVFTVPTVEDGSQNTSVTQAGLASDPMIKMMNEGFHTFEIAGNKFVAPFSSDLTASTGFTAYQIPGGVLSPVELTGTFVTTTTGTATLTVQVTDIPTVAGTPPIPSQSTITSTGGSVAISRASTSVLDATDINDFVQIENSSGQTVRNTSLNYSNSDEYAFLTQEALQQLADMRAQNGAEMSRINFAQDLLNINAVNLEAANSRIMDVDVAAESSQLARFQILQQAGTAMLAQANTSQQSLVRLLQG